MEELINLMVSNNNAELQWKHSNAGLRRQLVSFGKDKFKRNIISLRYNELTLAEKEAIINIIQKHYLH